MREIINELMRQRDESLKREASIARDLGLNPPNPRLDFFAGVSNKVTAAVEILDHYSRIWAALAPQAAAMSAEQIAREKQENAERVVMVLRWAFVETVSWTEYSAKRVVHESRNPDLKAWLDKIVADGGRVYLLGIMEKSKSLKLIGEAEFDSWAAINSIRNAIVHNNAIPDRNASLTIGSQHIEMKAGIQLNAKLSFFASVIGEMNFLWEDWIRSA